MSSNFQPFETALGVCGIAWSDAGIEQVVLPHDKALRRPRIGETSLARATGEPPANVRAAIASIVSLFDGEHVDLRFVQLDESGLDDFQRAVYAAAREIPPGETASYGEIATAIGEPGAARAVGAALGRNPYPIIVPCHRVLAATGALHGFSAPGGIATKRRMLEIERAPGFTQQALFA
ncbi:MAG TPA: methylated-DNA--[protein]-cysteine S-methyltransferase [Solirubrobacteraceae bacterium]|jgi:methylated-DNA-[protein]-cysteine S-methyltransferase